MSLFLQSMGLQAGSSLDPEEEKLSPTKEESPDKEKNLVTGYVCVLTNNIFRGISQTDNKPGVQGSIVLNDTFTKTGIYLNLVPSSSHIDDIRERVAYVEIDTVAGISNPVGDNFKYDCRVIRYNYPGSQGLSYSEGIISGQFYFLTALIGYSSNVYDLRKPGTYVNVGFQYDIPKEKIELTGISISGGIGYYKLSRSADLRSYVDYNLMVNKTFEITKALELMVSLQWTDTNGKSVDPSRLSRNHVVGMLTLSF